MDRFEVPRGTRDFLPDEMVVRNHVERVVRDTFESYGFQQIQTPTFENFDLFAARSGDEIRESMFTFASDAGRYALRPELTAPVCRVVASGALADRPLPYKLYYLGPCFRYCKPREGRYREFFQVGAESIGAVDELADAESIAVAVKVFRQLGISNFRLQIGNVGIFQKLLAQQTGAGGQLRQDWEAEVIHDIDRLMHTTQVCQSIARHDELRQQDIAFVTSERKSLHHIQDDIDYDGDFKITPDEDLTEAGLREQLDILPKAAEDTFLHRWNVELSLPVEKGRLLMQVAHLRGPSSSVLPAARELLRETDAIPGLDSLSRVCQWLTAFGVDDYEVVLGIVRNLDFYTGTVFEIDSELLGVRRQVCGGGRYDKLVQEFGGEPMPATGFAFGFDRLVTVFKQRENEERLLRNPVDVLVICDETVRAQGVEVAETIRDAGLRVGMDLAGRSLDDQAKYADELQLTYSVLLHADSAADECTLRQETASGRRETRLPVSAVADKIKQRMKSERE